MKKVVLTAYLVSFDGVDIVMHLYKLDISEEINKTLQNYLKTITKQRLSLSVFNVVESEDEINLEYFGLIDYEEILESQAHLFVPIQNYKVTTETKYIQNWLNTKVSELDSTVLRNLVGEFFTIDDMHYVYELVTKTPTDKGNFHKAVKKKSWLKQTANVVENVSYRPPKVFTFSK